MGEPAVRHSDPKLCAASKLTRKLLRFQSFTGKLLLLAGSQLQTSSTMVASSLELAGGCQRDPIRGWRMCGRSGLRYGLLRVQVCYVSGISRDPGSGTERVMHSVCMLDV